MAALPAMAATAQDRAAKLEAIERNVRAQHSLTPSVVEATGRKALNETGRRRFYGLWRVLAYYRASGSQEAFGRWATRIGSVAARDHDPALLALIQILSPRSGAEPTRPIDGAMDADVARVATLERLRDAVTQDRWALAATLGAKLTAPGQETDPLGLPVIAEAHTLLSRVASALGDDLGALDHMAQAVEIDQKSQEPAESPQRIYNLTLLALKTEDYASAERLLTLHREMIKTAGGPRARFFNHYLCAAVADAQDQWLQVLECLQAVDTELNAPSDRWTVSALRLRLNARARLGDVPAARADLQRLQAAVAGSPSLGPSSDLLSQAYILRAEGRGIEAFDRLDAAGRQALTEVRVDHQRKIRDISSALQTALAAERDKSERAEQATRLEKRLALAWTLVAGLLAILVALAVVWSLRQRALTRALTGARQRAEAANAAKSTFLATLSHELRTPLNVILPRFSGHPC